MPLDDEQGLELIDAARGLPLAAAVAVAPRSGALRAQARAGTLPAIFGELVQVPRPRARAATGSLAARAGRAARAPSGRGRAGGGLRAQAAAVLGHASRDAVWPEVGRSRSWGSIRCRRWSCATGSSRATGLKLPATLVFDHPTPVAVGEVAAAGAGRGIAVRGVGSASVVAVDEPLAIVGMACRYPGGVCSPEELWRLVESGGDAIGEFPSDRGWDVERLFDPDPDQSGHELYAARRVFV